MAGLDDLRAFTGGAPEQTGAPDLRGLAGLQGLVPAEPEPEPPKPPQLAAPEDIPAAPAAKVTLFKEDTASPALDRFPSTVDNRTPEIRMRDDRHNMLLEALKGEVAGFDDQFTFTERMSNRLGIGWTRKVANDLLDELTSMQDELLALENQEAEAVKKAVFPRPITQAGEDPQAAVAQKKQALQERIAALQKNYIAASDAVHQPTMRRGGDLIDIPVHPVMQALQAAQQIGDDRLVNRILTEFLPESMAETALPSITQAGPAQLLVPGGAAAGLKLLTGSTSIARGGFVVGTGFVSGSVESAASFSEYLAEQGVDMTDIEAVTRAIADPVMVKKARAFAFKRGASVALFDALGAFLGSKMLVPPGLQNKVARQLVNASAQLIQNPTTGALGEAAAQAVAGQEFNALDVKLEFLGELPTAVSEPIIFHLADKLGKKPSDFKTVKDVMDAFIENPAMTEAEALVALREIAANGMTDQEAIDLVQSIPGVKLNPQLIENTDHERAGKATSVPRKEQALIQTQDFVDENGVVTSGASILSTDPGREGKVYWSTEDDATDAGIDALTLAIENKQLQIELLQSTGSSSTTLNQLINEQENLKERKGRVEKAAADMAVLRPQLHALYQEMVNLFMPGQNLIIIENSLNTDQARTDNLGYSSTFVQGAERTGVIFLNTTHLMDMFHASQNQSRNQNRRRGPGMVRSVLAVAMHEFGHNVMQHYADTLPQEVLGALKAEHRNWLAKRVAELKKDRTLSVFDILRTKKNPSETWDAFRFLQGIGGIEVRSNKPDYNLGFIEWVADSFSSTSSDKTKRSISPILRKHMPRIQAIMQRFFDRFRSQMPDNTTFDTFMQYIQARAARETREALAGQLSNIENQLPAGRNAEVVMALLESKAMNIPKEMKDEIEASLDTHNRLIRWGLTILQLGKENKHIAGLQDYIKAVHEHWITKSNWNDQAMQTMNAWRKLGRKQSDMVGRYLLEKTVASDDLGRKLTNDEIAALLKEKGLNLSPEAWEVVQRVEGDLKNALEELYILEKNRLGGEYADAQTILKGKIIQLDKLFDDLRNRDYFPLSRFGEFGIAMKATKTIVLDGKTYNPGDTVHFELFENKRQRNRGEGTLRRKFPPSVKVNFINLTEPLKPFTGMPMAIMRSLKDNPKLGLTEEQRRELQGMIDVMSPTQGIAKRMLERKGTEGFHADATRGYANYMIQMGSHIAKMRHVGQMDEAIDSVRRSARYLGSRGILNDKRHEIVNHMVRHQEYLLRPENEWGGMRALAFHWFLGYNVKSAMVNLTQVPLVAYPYLAARSVLTGKLAGKSDAIAAAALVKASTDVANVFKKKGFKYEPQVAEMLDILRAEGIIDESLATELAGQAHGDLITQMMPGQNRATDTARRGLGAFLRGSTFMFQAAEKYNRRVVSVATYRLARKAGMDHNTAIDEAREALRATQFEYARWNRAAFMRGKAGVFFVFMQYLQNILFFVAREPGKGRYLMMMFLAAGLQGLPGAEDLMDLVDAMGRQWKRWAGYPDPRTDVREDLRQTIMELGTSPELIMHGLSAQSFGLGLPQVNDMLGTSIPSLSFEASISAGRVIPGWQHLMSPTSMSGTGAAAGAKDILGAAITIPINMMRWSKDTDPDEIRAFERMAPSILKGAARAYRVASGADEEGISTLRGPGGKKVVDFDMNNYEHIAELIGMSLGFNPTRVQFAQEKNFSEREVLQYYGELRQRLQVDYNFAQDQRRYQGDDSGIKPATQAIKEFNKVAPKGQQMLNFAQSYLNHVKTNSLQRKGLGRRTFDAPLLRDIQETFPRATEEQLR